MKVISTKFFLWGKISLSLIFVFFLSRHLIDHNKLIQIAENEVFGQKLEEVSKSDDLTKIKKIHKYVKSHVSYEGLSVHMDRPLLRATEIQTLKSGKGFCGENVRVMIKFLDLVNIDARRFYLFGESWEHVIMECKINGQWYLLDAHRDPISEMKEEEISTIPSPNFKLLRNQDDTNEYLDYHRIRFFERISFLKESKSIFLPHILVYFFESVYLLKCSITLFFLSILVYFEKKFRIK